MKIRAWNGMAMEGRASCVLAFVLTRRMTLSIYAAWN
jgi:hypothetical protein